MRRAAVIAVLLAGCADPPAAAGSLEIDTRAEREERDVDVYLATQVELLGSRPILERAIEDLGREADPSALRERLRVERRDDSSVLDVRVTVTGDPEEATELCNRIMTAYVEHRLHLVRATAGPDADWSTLSAGARFLEPCRPPVP